MSEEYIEKEEAIEHLLDRYEWEYPTASGEFDEYATKLVPNAIRNMKPADVKPVVRGEWVKVDDDLYWCSHCHSEIEMRDIYITECRYCPICGAEMRRGK